MAGYVDLYVLPVPRKNLRAYRDLALAWGRIILDHGALEYREWTDAGAKPMKGCRTVTSLLRLKRGEVLLFSVVGFRSKKHRDRVNGKAFTDPRMAPLVKAKPLFDMKRMYLGEFETFVGRAPR